MKKLVLIVTLLLIGRYTQAQYAQWYPLAQGAGSLVTAIDSQDSIIYISGSFTTAFGFAANNFGMYVNGHGVNPGAGFTDGYATTFLDFDSSEYAGGTFNGYFLRFDLQTKTWDSVAPVTNPVIRLDTFRGSIVLATDSSVMLYDTGTRLLSVLPMNFNGLLTDIAVYQNKIWMTAYTNTGDTTSKLYTWDGATIGDSIVPNAGIVYLYSDTHFLFISGREINGAENNVVAIYGGGRFSESSGNWTYSLLPVGYVTSISGNPSSGYLFGGSFQLVDGDGNYHPVALYQNNTTQVLGTNLLGTAYGTCFNSGGIPIVVGDFTFNDTSGNYNVVILGAGKDTATGISEIKKPDLFLYPNPFYNRFTVKNVPVNTTYILSNELGQTIAVIKSTGNELTFEDDQLTAGIYFLKEIEHPENGLKIIKQ